MLSDRLIEESFMCHAVTICRVENLVLYPNLERKERRQNNDTK